MENLKAIQVEKLDRLKTEEILNELTRLEGLDSGKQELKLKLQSTSGDITFAVEIVSLAHSMTNVDIVVEASGKIGPAGSIITAGGMLGKRTATLGTTFLLTEGDPYLDDVKAPELEDEDKTVYQTLSALTGRRSQILENIKSGKRFSTVIARKCRIIDSSLEFKSKYLHPKSSASESKSSNAGNPETSQNSDERPTESNGVPESNVPTESNVADNSAEGRRRGRPARK